MALVCLACRPFIVQPLMERLNVSPSSVKSLTRLVALCDYENPMRRLIYKGKYEADWITLRLLGELLAEQLLELCPEPLHPLIIIPMPVTPARLKERGFNQTELLGEALVDHWHRLRNARGLGQAHLLMQSRLLTRADASGHMAGRSKAKRQAMDFQFKVADNLCCQTDEPQPEYILLDDVMTTGSTAKAALKALTQAGLEVPLVLTAARTLAKHS